MFEFSTFRLGRGATPGGMVLALLAAGAVVPGNVSAQSGAEGAGPLRGEVMMYGDLALPVGEFATHVDLGGGGGIAGTWLPDASNGLAGIRVEGTFVLYGRETTRTPLSMTVQHVEVDVETTNYILSAGIGPQLYLSRGAIRPYVFGTVGVAHFATETSVRGSNEDRGDDFASSTNLEDTSLALTGGGGFMVRVSGGENPVSLDFSASYQYNGETEYLTHGGVQSYGPNEFPTVLSDTNMVAIRVGLSVGLR